MKPSWQTEEDLNVKDLRACVCVCVSKPEFLQFYKSVFLCFYNL